MPKSQDVQFLLDALALADQRRGFCAPNPAVGAIIVDKNNHIIAQGYHQACGLPHAEVVALQQCDNPVGATVYVTLEPCCHWGKTPPCTDALIQAKVKRVVYAYQDPNPQVAGKSTALLAAAGIICDHVSVPAIHHFYQSYTYWSEQHQPFVTAKIALSLDGKIAGEAGRRISITGSAMAEITHRYRLKSDAILTTAHTVINDNPQLNARYQEKHHPKAIYVVDTNLTVPKDAQILKTARSVTLFHRADIAADRVEKAVANGFQCVALEDIGQKLCLKKMLQTIGQTGVHDVWVEAGGTFFAALHEARLVHRSLIYIGLQWLPQGLSAFSNQFQFDFRTAKSIHSQAVGQDILCHIEW